MPEEKIWYYAKDGKAVGPFIQRDLVRHFNDGNFSASDYIFCKGQTEGWVRASTIPGLCGTLELAPEPEPERHEVPLYERAGYQHAVGETNRKVAQKDLEKKFWDKVKGEKK